MWRSIRHAGNCQSRNSCVFYVHKLRSTVQFLAIMGIAMQFFARIFLGLVCAIVAAGAAVAIEAGLIYIFSEIFNARIYPRGLGWFVLPVFSAIAGFRIGIEIKPMRIWHTIRTRSDYRMAIAIMASWGSVIACYVIIFEPFGYRMDAHDYAELLKWYSLPLLAFFGSVKLFEWARKDQTVRPPDR